MAKIKLFNVTFVNTGFISNVTTLIIFKTVMNPGTAQNVDSLSCDKNFLACCANTDNSIKQWKEPKSARNSSLLLKPKQNLDFLVDQFSNSIPENNNDPEKKFFFFATYYDTYEMHNVEIPNKNKSLSLLQINACSLNKNFDNLQHPLICAKINFAIMV